MLAADLGAAHGRLEVCDLAGAPLAGHDEVIRIADGPERVLAWVGEAFDGLLAQAGRGGAGTTSSPWAWASPGRSTSRVGGP